MINLSIQDIHAALVPAFDEAGLERLAQFHLGSELADITNAGNRSAKVLDLIQWAKSQGKLDRLLMGALAENPGNEGIRSLFESLSDDSPSPLQVGASQAYLLRQLYDEVGSLREEVEVIRRAAFRSTKGVHYTIALAMLYVGVLILTPEVRGWMELKFATAMPGALFVWAVATYLFLYARGSIDRPE